MIRIKFIFNYFLLFSLIVHCKFNYSSATPCTKLPSFLINTIGKGIDIASIDLYPRLIDLQKGYTMFKDQLINLNCDKNEFFHLKDQEYQLPDEIFRIYDHRSQDYTRHSVDFKDELDYRKKMAMQFGTPLVDGVLRGSPTYRRIKRQEYPRIRDKVQYVQTEKIVRLVEPYSLKLTDKIENEIKRLPEEYNESPRAYEEFIEKFGTHYFHKLYFGESARIEFERMSDDEKQEIYRLVQNQNRTELAKLSIFNNKNSDLDISKEFIYNPINLVKYGNLAEEHSILFENDINWKLIRQDELRKKIFTVYGGQIDANANVTYENKYFNLGHKRQLPLDTKYQKDLLTTWLNRGVNMWMLSGKITGIDQLMPESTRKESFKKAVKAHLEAAELEDGN